MKLNKRLIAAALAAAFPLAGAQAQTAAELLKEIDALKVQLKQLETMVQSVREQAATAVPPQEFNRLQQKIDLADDQAEAAGWKGLKFKGVIEPYYVYDRRQRDQGFDAGNGNGGMGMIEITKDIENGPSLVLRLTPGAGARTQVHEATVSVPIDGNKVRLNAGLIPDYQGYEYSFAHQNPLVTHNLMWAYAGPTAYAGAGLTYVDGPWTVKWMFGNIDGQRSGKSPGFAYRGDYTVNEFTYVGFAGAHSRTTRNYDLFEVDAGIARGDWTLNGQLNYGKERGQIGADGSVFGSLDGRDARWWGLSALAGYKLSPRLQVLGRFDYINNRKNGGGIYVLGGGAGGNDVVSGFGPELDSTGTVIDPDRGANRYQLTAGLNYLLMPNTTLKAEITLDRASGYNFQDAKTGAFKKSNVRLGTSVVVSF